MLLKRKGEVEKKKNSINQKVNVGGPTRKERKALKRKLERGEDVSIITTTTTTTPKREVDGDADADEQQQHQQQQQHNGSNLNLNRKRQREKTGTPADATAAFKKTKSGGGGSRRELFSDASFGTLKLESRIVESLEKNLNITQATKVQKAAIGPMMNGKDVLVKAKTGSGKTLAYLIPTIQLLYNMTIKREEGTYALVLAPTRELCLQINEVLSKLIKPFHWLVSGTILGGEKKKSEKARLRKGVTILVATPGRMLDHLQHTKSFRIDKLRVLVLDEADRLLDMGFERDVVSICQLLEKQRGLSPGGVAYRRQNMLISATLKQNIERLASVSLFPGHRVFVDESKFDEPTAAVPVKEEQKPQVSASKVDASKIEQYEFDEFEEVPAEEFNGNQDEVSKALAAADNDTYQAPSGLKQHFTVVHLKSRLVTLLSFLSHQLREKRKIVVFFSNIHSVEFHYSLFSRLFYSDGTEQIDEEKSESEESDEESEDEDNDEKAHSRKNDSDDEDNEDDLNEKQSEAEARNLIVQQVSLKVGKQLFKLHGDLSQVERTKIYFDFCKAEWGLLLCTDVAARGLDLPAVDWIVQYDPPTQTEEYVHRVGRTARIGFEGVLHNLFDTRRTRELGTYGMKLEELRIRLSKESKKQKKKRKTAEESDFEIYLKKQIALERLILSSQDLTIQSKNAFTSSARAYTTHACKKVFHIKNVHLGHLAKSFGLREPPTSIGRGIRTAKKKQEQQEREEWKKNKKKGKGVSKSAMAKAAWEKNNPKVAKKSSVSEFDA